MALKLGDGNAFAILGAARAELKKLGRSDEIDNFTEEATSGDYNNVLATVVRYFDEIEFDG